MSKVRVSALAKELGVTSKVLLERLNEMGEYVRSASSTVEAPVVRRVKEKFPSQPAEAAPVKAAPAKPAAAKSASPAPAAPAAPAPAAPVSAREARAQARPG